MELEQIQDFDIIYIYHHLKIGTELSFNNGSVYFKNFKLGLLKIDSMYYDRVGMVKIESIEKDKFLPPTKISVVVEMKIVTN